MPAVTIALWGPLFVDDASRRLVERQWRREHVVACLVGDGTCDADTAEALWRTAVTTFEESWHQQQHTPGIAYCIAEGLAAEGLRPGPGFDELVADLETRALVAPPPLVPGSLDALASLAERFAIGIVCDVQVTPAPVLRDCLDAHGLGRFLDAAVFSDEVGAAKPARTGFRIAAQELGVLLSDMVHVGPSNERDVSGALAAGARAVHLGTGPTEAHAQCADMHHVPACVLSLLESC